MYYINVFFFYSIIGYILESIGAIIFNNNFESGILYGPWTPLYGLGALIIMFISSMIFKKLKLNKFLKTLILFILVTLILTLLEYLAGISIEKLFHETFWDYSTHKYHIGKYISLSMSLVWGISSIIFVYLIKKPCDKIILKIPKYITYLFSILFIADIIVTIINKIYD